LPSTALLGDWYVCHQATFLFQFFFGMIIWSDFHLWHRIECQYSVWFRNPGEDQSDFRFLSWWVRMVAQIAICITYITCVLWFDLHPLFFCRRLKSRAVYLTDLTLSYKGHGVCAFSFSFFQSVMFHACQGRFTCTYLTLGRKDLAVLFTFLVP
jgi:hypothetical protein